MADRLIWTRWQDCLDVTGDVSETPPPSEPGRWDDDYDDPDGAGCDDRRVVTLIGGVDWLDVLHERWASLRPRPDVTEVRVTVRRLPQGNEWGWSGRLTECALDGYYGRFAVGGDDVARALFGLVGSGSVRLWVEGRIQVRVPRQVVVRLAHPWRRHAPGAYVTVTEREAAAIQASGRLARPQQPTDSEAADELAAAIPGLAHFLRVR